MKKFPKGFLWGSAASGVQTEGYNNKVHDSIWDAWFKKDPQRFYKQISSEVVSNSFVNYKADIQLMKDIGFNSFRTSIQWSRLIKDFKTGETDPVAVSFYNDYIDEMISNGIEPIMGLYHFDMPYELQEIYGGFESKEVVDYYVIYAKKAFELFGDRVKKFVTFNEPIVPVEGGYLYDFHYPNKNDMKLALQVGYNTILAHAQAVSAYRSLNLSGEIGVVLNLTPSYTEDDSEENKYAAYMADLIFNRSFLDPMVLGVFPNDLVSEIGKYNMLPEYTKEELDIIEENGIDFLGVNYYVPRRVRKPSNEFKLYEFSPERYFENYVDPSKRLNPYRDNNEIHPEALYDIAQNINKNYNNIPWYVSEIGIAMDLNSEGAPVAGIIDDSYRIGLLEEHLAELHRAIEEGSSCFGIHTWTFIDNWSWINSFKRRYGFYRLDLDSGERILKKSGLWFKTLTETNTLEVK